MFKNILALSNLDFIFLNILNNIFTDKNWLDCGVINNNCIKNVLKINLCNKIYL